MAPEYLIQICKEPKGYIHARVIYQFRMVVLRGFLHDVSYFSNDSKIANAISNTSPGANKHKYRNEEAGFLHILY